MLVWICLPESAASRFRSVRLSYTIKAPWLCASNVWTILQMLQFGFSLWNNQAMILINATPHLVRKTNLYDGFLPRTVKACLLVLEYIEMRGQMSYME